MIHKVFAVYDLKTCAYLQPFFSGHTGGAMRAFGDAVADSSSPFAKHPGDYQLFEIGLWDDNVGELQGLNPVKVLCSAADYVVHEKVKPSILNGADKVLEGVR
ncbi:MAG: nonstructural protein [Microvirus sp.]|nr:MAG: nonstructural protein [Microvirus sp.]